MREYPSINQLNESWSGDDRWKGIQRNYTAEDVARLRGSVRVDHTLAELGAAKLWDRLQKGELSRALGALSGNQAVQQVQAGLKAIYLSGWQVAADANNGCQMYPDQSLYPADSVPTVVRRINNALQRADQIQTMNSKSEVDWFQPIVADAEAGFGGNLNAFELMKGMIEAGAAGVHFEDQLSSAKKCGHMGGKVLVPAQEFVNKLNAARFASDVMDVATILIARTDADSAGLLMGEVSDEDRPFLTGEQTPEGFRVIKGGLELAITRALQYAPYADLIWCETSTPDVGQAREFAAAVREKFPNKMFAYNCSPSFNWKLNLDDKTIASFQEQLAEMGYLFQFVTLAGFHSLNHSMFKLANQYRDRGMAAYSELQEDEFKMQEEFGFGAIKHQAFVGTGYFDQVQVAVSGGRASTTALTGSTEEAQFNK